MMPAEAAPAADPLAGRRATISDVALAAGVSRTTVSYVLSGRAGTRVPDTTRRRIQAAAAQVGYKRNALAVAFRSGRMNTFGIVSPVDLMTAAPGTTGGVYYKDLVLAIAAAGFEAGMNPLLMSEDTRHALSLSDITDRRADGVILVVKENAGEFVRAADAAGVPCVTVGRDYGAWQVHTDSIAGAHLAVAHLWDLGHRRIAYLWYGKPDVLSGQQRRDGFRDALAIRGGQSAGEFTNHDRDALAQALRSPGGSTAVFCYNDELAVWLFDLCREIGVESPREVSVVSFDDSVLAVTTRPRLTTVRHSMETVASTALAMLQQQLNRGDQTLTPPAPVLIAPTLIVRESTASPPAEGDSH